MGKFTGVLIASDFDNTLIIGMVVQSEKVEIITA